MAVLYTSLITRDDLEDAFQDAFKVDFTDEDTQETIDDIINAVTGMMEGASGLGRNLIVRQYNHYFQSQDWDYDKGREKFFVRAPQWPVVEIDTSGFTTDASRDSWQNESNLILYTSRYSGVINYYAGYKRQEQTLVALQGESDLANLDTLPGDLPHDIRSVAIDVIMKEWAERRQGPGQRTRVMNPAVQSTTIQEVIRDYMRMKVRDTLGHHKKWL